MIVKPSIAFNDFFDTAKDLTARSVHGRSILSSRAQHSKIITPAQAVSRNRLSRISRTFRQLSDSQISQSEVLAGHMKGISTLGSAAEMAAHNAFVRINSNRAMVGMPPLTDAPAYINDVPEVLYGDLWISPDMIIFTGLQQPSESHTSLYSRCHCSQSWSIFRPGADSDYHSRYGFRLGRCRPDSPLHLCDGRCFRSRKEILLRVLLARQEHRLHRRIHGHQRSLQ